MCCQPSSASVERRIILSQQKSPIGKVLARVGRVESENPRLSGTRHGPDPAARLGEGARIGQSSGVDVGENEDATSGREVVDHSKGGIDGFTGEVVRYPFPYEYRPDNGIEAGGKQRIGEPVVLEIDGHVGNVSAVEAQTVDD